MYLLKVIEVIELGIPCSNPASFHFNSKPLDTLICINWVCIYIFGTYVLAHKICSKTKGKT